MIVDLLASPAVAGFSVSKIRGQGPLLAWTPWSAVTALGAGLAVAGAGFRLPRWQLLALGMVLFLGAGADWVAETVITASGAGGGLGADQRVQPGPAAAPHPRETLGAVMATVADGDTSAACFLFI